MNHNQPQTPKPPRSFRRRLPTNQWEDEMVKRLVLNRWERDKGKPVNRDRAAETFLKRQANAKETLAALQGNRKGEGAR
jgi:hypothetical protein